MEITPDDTNAKDDTSLRGWTREEIRIMLTHADVRKRAAILMLASSGMRPGGLRLKWGDVSLICSVDGKLVDEKDPNKLQDAGNPVCASVRVYRGTPEEYVTFITLEAHGALMEYAAEREAEVGRALEPDDLIFTKQKTPSAPVDITTVTDWINRIVKDSGVGKTHAGSRRGHNVPILNGFRRFWNKTFSDNVNGNAAASSAIKEYMIGHRSAMPPHATYYHVHSNRIKDPEKPISELYSLFYLSCLAYGGIRRRTGSECTDFANLIAICEISFSGSLIRLLCNPLNSQGNTCV